MEAEETDVWWGSYAWQSTVLHFVACGVLTAAVAGSAYAAGAAHPPRVAYWVAGPVWLLVLAWWVYRMSAFNYRLTTRRLFRGMGFTRAPEQVELVRVVGVTVQRSAFERWMGVGQVRVERGPEGPPLVLEGVRDPEQVARAIRRQVEEALACSRSPKEEPPGA
jgi:hypothetical protein